LSAAKGRTGLVFGAGGLGGPAALALAAAGSDRLVLADAEPVALTDLAVQPLLAEAEVGQPRAGALARALARLHPGLDVAIDQHPLDAARALDLLRTAHVVVEATGHAPTMFLVNDAAAEAGVPVVHGALLGFTAQLVTVLPGTTGCLRCLFEGPPPRLEPSVAEPDPLGPLAGFVGSLLGVEAARLLDGRPGAHAGQLLSYEARSGWSRTVPVRPRPGCPACGARQAGAPGAAGGTP
jgi:molybdopterin/thiamine biosynthesis adenylyltransferase